MWLCPWIITVFMVFVPFFAFSVFSGILWFCLKLSFVILSLIVLFFLVNLGGGAVFTF